MKPCANADCGHAFAEHTLWGCNYMDDFVSVCPCNYYAEPEPESANPCRGTPENDGGTSPTLTVAAADSAALPSSPPAQDAE